MTLTELRYIVAVAQEKHFGRAAQRCHVSQPTLSIAIKKLEEELGLSLFDRSSNEVMTTNSGARIVAQARRVLDEAEVIRYLANEEQAGRQFQAGLDFYRCAVFAAQADFIHAPSCAENAVDAGRELHRRAHRNA